MTDAGHGFLIVSSHGLSPWLHTTALPCDRARTPRPPPPSGSPPAVGVSAGWGRSARIATLAAFSGLAAGRMAAGDDSAASPAAASPSDDGRSPGATPSAASSPTSARRSCRTASSLPRRGRTPPMRPRAGRRDRPAALVLRRDGDPGRGDRPADGGARVERLVRGSSPSARPPSAASGPGPSSAGSTARRAAGAGRGGPAARGGRGGSGRARGRPAERSTRRSAPRWRRSATAAASRRWPRASGPGERPAPGGGWRRVVVDRDGRQRDPSARSAPRPRRHREGHDG